VAIIIFKLLFVVVGGLKKKKISMSIYWNIGRKNVRRLFKMYTSLYMSAIKTHEIFNVVQGDDITYENDQGEEQTLTVKSLMVERQRPSVCQIFTEKENVGSMARETKCFHASIETITPSDSHTEFAVRANIYHNFHNLQLKTVRSESSECTIS
jgi:hypothetical protein